MARRISELFFELRAKTEGLKKDLDDSERHLGKWSQFVAANPTAVAGALAAALVGIGIKATLMAAETDKAIRSITANLPKGTAAAGELRETIDGVAKASGVARSQVADLAKEVARLGAGSQAEFKAKVEAAQLVADATGIDPKAAAQGIDQLTDLFEVGADKIVESVAKLASAARGRVDFDSLFGAFQAAAPRIRELGLSVDEATGAIVRLLDEGRSAKQVTKILGEHDAEQIRAYAAGAHGAADALKELHDQAEITRGGLERNNQRIKDEFNKRWEDLGTRLLPPVNAGLEAILRTLDAIDAHPVIQRSLRQAFTSGLNSVLPGAGTLLNQATSVKPLTAAELAAPLGNDPALVRALAAPSVAGAGLGETIEERQKRLRALADAAKDLAADLKRMNEALERESDDLEKFVGRTSDAMQKIVDDGIETLRRQYHAVLDIGSIIQNAPKPTAADGTAPDFLGDADRKSRERTREIQEQSRAIRESVNGAIALAEAFGTVDKAVIGVLRSVGELAAGIAPLKDALSKVGKTGKDGKPLGSDAAVIGAALPIASAVFTTVNALNALTGAANNTAAALNQKFAAAFATLGGLDQQLAALRGSQPDAVGQARAQAQTIRDQIERDLAGKALENLRNDALAKVNAAEAERIAQLTLEAIAAEQATAAAEAKAAADAAIRQRDYSDDLRVRELIAQGRGVEAETLRQQIDQQREMEAALAAGFDAATIAGLTHIQELEREALAQEQAARSAEEAARKIEEATRAQIAFARQVEDLDVRKLRAQGKTEEADDLAFKHQQERERADFLKTIEGVVLTREEFNRRIADFDEVQRLERDAREKGEAPTATGRRSNAGGSKEAIATAAKSLTEVTGNRMADYLASILAVDRHQLQVMQSFLNALTKPIITGPILPPTLPPWFAGGGLSASAQTASAGLVVRNTFIVHVHAPVKGEDAAAVGKSIAKEAAKEFDQILGDQYAQAQARAGSTLKPI